MSYYNYWQWTLVTPVTRPLFTISENKKDMMYDVTMSRWWLSRVDKSAADDLRREYAMNTAFYQGLVFTPAEKETFLADQGLSNSRPELGLPIMQPLVTRVEGSALNVSTYAHAESTTSLRAKLRKEDEMNEAIMKTLAAQQGSYMASAVNQMTGLSQYEDETREFVDSTYQDKLADAITKMTDCLAAENDLDGLKGVAARKAFLSGLWCSHDYIHGDRLRSEMIDPMDCGFDPNSKRQDFMDGQFMYVCPLMTLQSAAERWQNGAETIKHLDEALRQFGVVGGVYNSNWSSGMLRVATVYWKDMKRVRRGWIEKDGHPHLCVLDEEKDGVMYTKDDCIEPPKEFTDKYTNWPAGKRWDDRWVEYVRYCSFVPWEWLPGTQGKPYVAGKTPDVVFDNGVYELQEEDPDDWFSVRFPIKMKAWSYVLGRVLAPATCVQSPQRVMNMVFSDLMWRLSKSGIGMPVFDQKAVANAGQTMQQVIFNWKEGIPTELDGSIVGSLSNAIGVAPGNLDAGFYNAWTILPQLRQIVYDATGIQSDAYGNNAPRKSVGTTEIAIEQTNIILRPFMEAQVDWFKMNYQFFAQGGKQFYSTLPWSLAEMVGDEGVAAMIASEDASLERFRIHMDVDFDARQLKQEANMMIDKFLQMGMLDQEAAANIYDDAFPRTVVGASKKYTGQAKKAAQMQQQQMQQQQQQMMIAQQGQQLDAEEMELSNQAAQHALEADKINQKSEEATMKMAAQSAASSQVG